MKLYLEKVFRISALLARLSTLKNHSRYTQKLSYKINGKINSHWLAMSITQPTPKFQILIIKAELSYDLGLIQIMIFKIKKCPFTRPNFNVTNLEPQVQKLIALACAYV